MKICTIILLWYFIVAMPALQADMVYDEAVSLGFSCEVCWELENSGKRFFAYPFDWFYTPFDSLTAFLKNKGSNFLDPDKITIVGPYPGHILFFHVVDMVYGIQSFHDFLVSPPMANYIAIKDKYDRRIKRFFELLESKKRVLFVRQGCTRAQMEELDGLLQSLYPSLSYTILALDEEEEFLEDWRLERIKNYYLKKVDDWHGDVVAWQEILTKFPMAPRSEVRSPEDAW